MIKHAGTHTTHTIAVDDMDANLAAGFLWEALDKLHAPEAGLDSLAGAKMVTAATNLARALFTAAGLDFVTYDGTKLLTCEHGPTLFAEEATKSASRSAMPSKRAGTR